MCLCLCVCVSEYGTVCKWVGQCGALPASLASSTYQVVLIFEDAYIIIKGYICKRS